MSKIPAFLCGLALSILLPSTVSAQALDTRTAAPTAPAALSVRNDDSGLRRHRKPKIAGDFIAASRINRKALPRKAASATPLIYANIVDYAEPGIYTFTPEQYEFTEVVTGDEFANCGGAAYANGVFIGVNDNRMAYKWNADDWSQIGAPVWSELIRGTAMAANPIDGTVYSCAYNLFGQSTELVTVDTETFLRSSTIGALEKELMAMFFDGNGTLWAFDGEGGLYTVNTSNAALTFVGDTGIDAYFDGAAVIDPESGLCYYATCDWECSLYEVNLETCEASWLYDFDNEEQVTSIFILPAAPESGAPDKAQSIAADFADGSLSGTINFTAPDKTFDGNAGSGTLSYTLTANDATVASSSCDWGASVSVEYTAAEAAFHTFSVVFSTDAGESRPAAVAMWVGNDAPSAVSNAKATRSEGVNTISWSAPQTSLHGGYVNFSELTYSVHRLSDNALVAENITATSCTDTIADGNSPEACSYEVVAYFAGNASPAAQTNQVMVGAVYYNSFDDASQFDEFTSVSLANDGPEWEYSKWYNAASVSYNETAPVSAWLSSPGLYLTAGTEYNLTFDAWCSNDSYTELLSVFINDTNSAAALYSKTPLINRQVINWESSAKRNLSATFTPETSGTYYITFNGCSQRDMGTTFIDNVLLYPTPAVALPEAPEISVELSMGIFATVTIVAPSKDTDGATLTSLTKITLARDGQHIYTFENPEPGEELIYNEFYPGEGSFYYTAVAYTENGRSADATAILSTIEPTKPFSPSGVTFYETENEGEVTISWSAPSIDLNGNPIADGSLTFNIYCNGELLIMGLTSTSYTYQAVPVGEQKFLTYYVTAVNDAGESSRSAEYEPQPFGTPVTVPFCESFAGMQPSQLWSFYNPDDYSDGEWLLIASSETPAVLPVDNDGGMLAFSAEMFEDTAIATSGKINLGSGQNPKLSFCYYANTKNKDRLDVSIDDGTGFKRLFSKVMRDDQITGWVKATLDLSKYAGKTVRLRFLAESARSSEFLLVDKIELTSIGNDLEATLLSVPGSVKCGLPFTAKAVITNNGSQNATGYKVALYRDGAKVAEINGKEIAAGASSVEEFEQTADATWNASVKYSFGIEFNADEVSSNNLSETVPVGILFSNYPMAENLTASYANAAKRVVNLEWAAPDQSNLPSALYTEDFEFFEAFEADPAGDWTFVDGDGDRVFGPSSFPFIGQNDPKAFVVLDADHFNLTYDAHSGHLYLASYSAQTKQTDDWMISPELTGEAQTVKFFARSYSNTYGLETFEILYSTSGNGTTDFVKLSTNADVPVEWTEYTAELPAGAVYFAIRCVSDQRFALFIDDVQYTPLVNPAGDFAIEGFNLYRNGIRLNTKPLLTASYTDAALPEGEPSYSVSVVYDHGESPLCAPVTPSTSGITDALEAAVSARAVANGIEISASGNKVAVFAADGKQIFAGSVSGKHFVSAAKGVYLVTSGKYVQKVIVR